MAAVAMASALSGVGQFTVTRAGRGSVLRGTVYSMAETVRDMVVIDSVNANGEHDMVMMWENRNDLVMAEGYFLSQNRSLETVSIRRDYNEDASWLRKIDIEATDTDGIELRYVIHRGESSG